MKCKVDNGNGVYEFETSDQLLFTVLMLVLNHALQFLR